MFIFYSSPTALGLGLWLNNVCSVLTNADSILHFPNHKCWWVNPLPKPPPLLLLLFIFFAFKYSFDLHLSWTAAWIFFFLSAILGNRCNHTTEVAGFFVPYFYCYFLAFNAQLGCPILAASFLFGFYSGSEWTVLFMVYITGLFWYLEVSFPPIFLLLFSPTIIRFRSIIHVGSIIPNLQVNLVMPLIGVGQSVSWFTLSWFAACFLCCKFDYALWLNVFQVWIFSFFRLFFSIVSLMLVYMLVMFILWFFV